MRKIWAVARQTFLEASRSRLTGMFIPALIAAVLISAVVSRTESLRDQIQTFLVYGISTTGLLLSILTILLACGILCGEIERRHIFTPLTKPISRMQYIVGRWLGIVLLQAILLTGCGLGVYGTVRYMVSRAESRMDQGDQSQIAGVEMAKIEVLTARVKHAPVSFARQLKMLMEQRIEELEKEGRYSQAIAEGNRLEFEREIYKWAESQLQTAPPLGRLVWRFEGLEKPTDPDALVQFRFTPSPSRTPPNDMVRLGLVFRNPADGRLMVVSHECLAMAPSTVTFPAVLISDDGRLDVVLENRNMTNPRMTFRTSLTVEKDEIHVLYPVDSFGDNFTRGILSMLLLQMFLAAMAMLTGSWLSFPVACLWCFVLYAMGLMASFITDAMSTKRVVDVGSALKKAGSQTVETLLYLLPDFQRATPAGRLVDGLLIPWTEVGWAAVTFVAIWTSLCLAAAGLILRRRELARVIVQ